MRPYNALLTSLFLLASALSAVGCDQEDSAVNGDAMDNGVLVREYGKVEFRLRSSDALELPWVDMSIARSDGAVVHRSRMEAVASEHGLSTVMSLPSGLGYTVSLSATTISGVSCVGQGTFNVLAGASTDLALVLACGGGQAPNKNGNVNIEVEVKTGDAGECPEISFISAFPRRVNVGGKIKLRSAASLASASFAWRAETGSFSPPNAADTEFVCTQVGPVDLELTVTSAPGCQASHVIAVDCLSMQGDPDAGSPASQPVELSFVPQVGSEAFDCAQVYRGLGTAQSEASPNDFRLFVYDVALVRPDGSKAAVELTDREGWQWAGVGLLDFEGGPSAQCYAGTPEMNRVLTGRVAKGDYVGLSFRIGLPTALNHANPTTLQAPLTAAGMAWTWLAGFKFAKLELGAGLMHVGSAACTGTPPEVTCNKSNRAEIVLDSFSPGRSEIVVDLAAAFADTDLSAAPTCHGTGEACAPMFRQIGIDFNSGQATTTQSMFRLR